MCSFGQLFNRLVLHVIALQVLNWCEPVNLDNTYRMVCSSEKSLEILSSGFKKKDTQDLKSNLLKKN